MKDKHKTELLTKFGYLHLRNMGCFEIATEVPVPHFGLRDWGNHQDRHYLIDLIGISSKYLPLEKQYTRKIETGSHEWEQKVIKEPIIRGIEVKVSRGDFKNGFIHVGCNYNYLLVPKGLVDKKEVHKDIGIIEADIDNLSIRKIRAPWYGFELTGIKQVRNPKRKPLTEEQISRMRGQIGYKLTLQTSRWLRDELVQSSLLKETEESE